MTRIRRSLSVLIALIALSSTSLLAQADIRKARETARRYQTLGRTIEALRLLERTLAQHPEASGVRRDLGKARALAADSLVQATLTVPPPDLPRQVELVAMLREIAPRDPRLPGLSASADSSLSRFRDRVEYAIESAEAGDLTPAMAVLPSLEDLARVLPASRDALQRLQIGMKLCEARRSVREGETLGAVQALLDADVLGAATESTAAIYKELENAELGRADLTLRSSNDPRAYLDIAYRLGILVKNCESCASSASLLEALRSRFGRQLRSAAESYSPLGPPASRMAECAIVSTLGESATLLTKFNEQACQIPAQSAAGSTRALDIRASENCSAPHQILNDLVSAASSEVARLTQNFAALRLDANGTIAGQLTLRVEGCTVSHAIKNRREVGSSYKAASTQVPSPEYSAAAQELAAAQKAADEANQLAALFPDGRYLATQIGATARLVAARKRMRRTPPMVEQAIEATYSFETFDQEATASIEGDFRVEYGGDHSRVLAHLNANASKSSRVVQGVNPADASGAVNKSANLPDESTLLRELWEEEAEQLKSMVKEAVATQVALAAADSMKSGVAEAAAAQLLVLPAARGYVSDVSLQYLISNIMANSLLPASELAALAEQDLAAISRKHPLTRSAPAAAAARHAAGVAQPGARFVPDVALDSVVLIVTERGNQGSGFFVRGDGLVLTNFHVVEGATLIAIKTRQAETATARILQHNQAMDVALLTVTGVTVHSASLASTARVSVGQPVFALGAPDGLEFSATSGIVSALRSFDGGRWIQHDAPLSPGSSGGPLIDADGKVIAVNSRKRSATGFEGLGFAIAIESVRKVLNF